jgi:hypothetical protein
MHASWAPSLKPIPAFYPFPEAAHVCNDSGTSLQMNKPRLITAKQHCRHNC